MIYLNNKITGTKKSIGWDISSQDWAWSSSEGISYMDWILGDEYQQNSVESILRIYGKEVKELIPENYSIMLRSLNLDSKANILKILGPKYSQVIKSQLIECAEWLHSRKEDQYIRFYQDTNKLLTQLQPAKIDLTRYRSIMNMGIDLGTEPYIDEDGTYKIPPPIYSRDRSKTGRFSIVKGVRALTMQASHRNILKDAWQLDFEALEPRFLLSLLGKSVSGDFYTWVGEQCGFKTMSRAQIKLAVISSMYGHKTQIPEVTRVLGLDVFEKELEKDVVNGWTRNWFGRPLNVKDVTGRHLVSLWLQSTAAEASVLGFQTFLRDNPNVTPHWLIHDAMIYSCDSQLEPRGSIIIEYNGMKITMPYKIGRVE